MSNRRLRNPLSLIVVLVFASCASTSDRRARVPSSENDFDFVPAWNLSGLGENYAFGGAPEVSCLEAYMAKAAEPYNRKPSANLAERILKTASVFKIDAYVFAGLVQQETGGFFPTDSVNGVGVTQMTSNTIKDNCYALEGTDCRKPYANPDYLPYWEGFAKNFSELLFVDPNFKDYYPWRKACAPGGTRCKDSCGIDSTCLDRIRDKLMDDDRYALFMGGLAFVNKLAEAKRAMAATTTLEELYREALKRYNAHPNHETKYANRIMDVHRPAIMKACPALTDQSDSM